MSSGGINRPGPGQNGMIQNAPRKHSNIKLRRVEAEMSPEGDA